MLTDMMMGHMRMIFLLFCNGNDKSLYPPILFMLVFPKINIVEEKGL